ncbi:MAG: Thiosulfate reductase molybdopterin-containing subunit PhsA [Anaerolineales bacterium]|nr:Thiosulfate reductase molybdopterin-containing subunit PhsA [Anaerolineales bacterium]
MTTPLTRRQFLKLTAVAGGSAAAMGGLQAVLNATPAGAEEGLLAPSGEEHIVPSVCLLCPSGCGVLVRVADGRAVKLEGNPMHPINTGSLCPKGQAAPELLYNPDRLTGPLRRVGERGSGEWEPITWDEAVQIVAQKLNDLRAAGHPERAACLYGETRGQMRPFIERFMQAVGSPNAISHDSLNIEAAKLATYYTQGVYDLPAYDLENSNYVLSFGANLLEAGRTPQRMVSGYSYMRRGRAERGKVVVIDPRQGVTGAKADEWIPIVPGTDAALALGLANVIIRSGLADSDFVHNYSFGFEDFKDGEGKSHKGFKEFVLQNYPPSRVEQITGVPATTISRLAGEFAGNPPAVAILPGKGGLLNGSINGLYTAMAVHMLNALVGSIETPGGVLAQRYFPCADWPQLPPDPVAERGRTAERLDGAGARFPLARHAYQAVADHISEGYPYPVEMLFLYDANPVYEVPGGTRFVEAFQKAPFIVSCASFMDETAQYADLVLPEPTFLERWQDDAIEGLGYPGVGLRQPVVEPLYDTLNTGDFLLRVAQAMGDPVAGAFPWSNFEELLKDRLKTIGAEWETLKELGVWMIPGYRFARRGSEKWVAEVVGRDRMSSPRDGRFDFFSRELNCALGELGADELKALGLSQAGDAVFLPHHEPVTYAGNAEYPFTLNVITLMSLGPYSAAANMPTLQEISGMTVGERWDSWLEMNPEAAHELELRNKDGVWVESPYGKLKTKVRLVKSLHPDVVNLPHNQGHTAVGRWARNRGVNGLEILNPASEPATGLASFTNTRVKVYKA